MLDPDGPNENFGGALKALLANLDAGKAGGGRTPFPKRSPK